MADSAFFKRRINRGHPVIANVPRLKSLSQLAFDTVTEFRHHSELPPACYETEYGLQIQSVTINAYPRQARITYLHSNLPGTLTLDCPSPLESFAFLFDGCYWLKIYDLNETGASLNFGRYEVHLLDEDSAQAKMICDRYTAD